MSPMIKRYATMIVGMDVVLVAIHALAHLGAGIGLSLAENVFVAGVIVFAPLLSLFLLHTRLAGMGVLLLSLSMFGAFIFGICGHFLLPGADNVLQIPSSVWRIPFQVTAVLLMVLQAAGTVVGVRCLYAVMRWKKASQAGPV
jgi:hypothetical protein